ncbi:MAG: iron-sulfur cluster co-chaperone HscB C-terminal domain-containing protein [Phycisphaerales bacterium JB065]
MPDSPSSHSDPFDLLGIEPDFPVDEARLHQAWLKATAANHPDRADDPEAAHLALSAVNQAYRTLSDPEKAANALLTRLGGPSPDQAKALPAGFLMEMREIRDELEEAKASKDPGKIAKLEDWADEQRGMWIQRVTEQFAAHSEADDRRDAIRESLNAWRYIERLIEQLDPEYSPAEVDFR